MHVALLGQQKGGAVVNRITSAGWLDPVNIVPSVNHNARPNGAEVSLLVVHNISLPPGQFGGGYVQQLFCNQLDCSAHPYFEQLKGLEVSAHCLIEREGAITQFVPFGARAWHAGVSEFNGRPNCNDFSIGIELEGTDDTPYTNAQYQALAAVAALLMQAYPAITPARMVGHSHIAPTRKTDPGPAFDWPRFMDSIKT